MRPRRRPPTRRCAGRVADRRPARRPASAAGAPRSPPRARRRSKRSNSRRVGTTVRRKGSIRHGRPSSCSQCCSTLAASSLAPVFGTASAESVCANHWLDAPTTSTFGFSGTAPGRTTQVRVPAAAGGQVQLDRACPAPRRMLREAPQLTHRISTFAPRLPPRSSIRSRGLHLGAAAAAVHEQPVREVVEVAADAREHEAGRHGERPLLARLPALGMEEPRLVRAGGLSFSKVNVARSTAPARRRRCSAASAGTGRPGRRSAPPARSGRCRCRQPGRGPKLARPSAPRAAARRRAAGAR